MGPASAPGAFQNLIELVFAGLSYELALVYLDDVFIFGRNFDEHLKQLELVFQRSAENRLKIKGSKCNFFSKKGVSVSGHIISESGVEVEKVGAVERMRELSSLNDVRAFLGLVSHYQKFSPVHGKTAEPLYSLLNKPNKVEWSTERKNAVTELKNWPLGAPVLDYPNDRDPYTLSTDASLTGIGAIRTQAQGTEDRVIAYASKTLSKN